MNETTEPLPALSRRAIIVEICLALGCVGFLHHLPYLWRVLIRMMGPGYWLQATDLAEEPLSADFLLDQLFSLLTIIPVYLLPLYFIFRSGHPYAAYGLVRPTPVEDTAGDWFRGLAIAFLSLSLAFFLRSILFPMAQYGHFPSQLQWPAIVHYWGERTYLQYGLLLVIAGMIGFAEELLFRGYLIPRLEHAGCPTRWAALVSSLVFAWGHLYQGLQGFIVAFILGAVWAGFFIKIRRVWPLMIAHFLLDFVTGR